MATLERHGKDALAALAVGALGRRRFARIARFLWQRSRLDVPNDLRHNGERRLIEAFAQGAAHTGLAPVIFDVGANVGEWSAHLVERLAACGAARPILHVFEPAPDVRLGLEQRLRAESAKISSLEVRAEAVADAVGEATFSVFGERARRSTLVTLGAESPSAVVDVAVTSLDAYALARGITRIDLVKIDTEGNDCRVLEGARGLLAKGAIGWAQLEYNHRWIGYRRYLRDVFELVAPFGYWVGKVTPLGIERYQAWHPELESYREGNDLVARGELPATLPTVPFWMQAP